MSESNQFLASLMAAMENDKPTDEMLDKAPAVGDPALPSQKKADDPSGNTDNVGDLDGSPIGKPDPDRTATEVKGEADGNDPDGNAGQPGDDKGNPNPTNAPSAAAEAETVNSIEQAHGTAPAAPNANGNAVTGPAEGNFKEFKAHVATENSETEKLTQQQKDANDPSGNTGDPATNNQTPTPASTTGESKEKPLDSEVKDSYDASGNTGSPTGDNGNPVSKSGENKLEGQPDPEYRAADDKTGNPDSPGVDGDPSPSFESFIAACEQCMTEVSRDVIRVPENMSLESYALELGLGEIAARACESSLSAAEKRALKDSDFGLPDERKWPLHDENHVRSAIQHFHWCPKDKQRLLAKNILKAMRRFNMKDVEVSEGNPFYAYYPEAKLVPRKKPERKN